MNNRPISTNENTNKYDQIQVIAGMRLEEISNMSKPYIHITDRFGQAIVRITLLLGKVKPKDIQDIVIRDLMADAFDVLYEARSIILSGKISVAFPLARRAFESISLLHLCSLEAKWAEKWNRGDQIKNEKVRKELDKHPMGERELLTKESYDFFCLGTHPNRELIPFRFLGDGNSFVLGVVGKPDLFMIATYCIKHLDLWFWLVATISYYYRDILMTHDEEFLEEYMQAHKEASEVKKWLVENQIHLRKETLDSPPYANRL